MRAAFWARASSSEGSLETRGTFDMLRLERPGFLAAARAETGVEPLKDGERLSPLVAALGERACPRVVDPLVECGSAGDDLLELPGVPGLRGDADMVQGPESVDSGESI